MLAASFGHKTALEVLLDEGGCDADTPAHEDSREIIHRYRTPIVCAAANGHLEEDINKVQKTQFYEQSPELFWNCGAAEATEFRPATAELVGSDFHRPLVGRSVAVADIDGDGDSDLFVTASGSKPRLLRNDQASGHHWLRVRLADSGANPEAIGALVSVTCTAGVEARRVSPTRGYQSQCELPVTFGLGSAAEPVDVRVVWPDGSTSHHPGLTVDRLHVITHPTTAVR